MTPVMRQQWLDTLSPFSPNQTILKLKQVFSNLHWDLPYIKY